MPKEFLSLVKGDPDLAAWTPVQFFTFELDGQAVPFMFEPPAAKISSPAAVGARRYWPGSGGTWPSHVGGYPQAGR